MRTIVITASVIAACAYGALAQQDRPEPARQQQQRERMEQQQRDRTEQHRLSAGRIGAEHVDGRKVAEILTRATFPMDQCIKTAERESNGKVAMVLVCEEPNATVGEQGRVEQQPKPANPDQPAQDKAREDAQERATRTTTSPVWVVTCLAAGNQLVEVTIDATNGRVVGKRNVPAISTVALNVP